jgi:5-methyltetrahydrofolate--homocysteine methyltransferase
MANTFFGGEAFPYFDTQIGPGSLGTFIGARPGFAETTVWYDPCIEAPDSCGPIRFDPKGNRWWDVHLALIEEGLRRSQGRYLVGMPDLIENIDTLAAMRDSQPLLLDLIERPDWVKARLAEINRAYFAAFEGIHEKIKEDDGGNAFSSFRIWGPGKTAKVQCDFSCMISPEMFREFVVPSLAEQCRWLDYSMYHLDGTTAMQHLDALLEIEALDAIQWTPQDARGGSPEWYDLYKRIKAGGKSVQACYLKPEHVLPLLDAVGPEGLFMWVTAPDEDAARKLIEKVRG